MRQQSKPQYFKAWDERHLVLLQRMKAFAQDHDPVLIMGETGTGKTLLAREIHNHSPRAGNPMIKFGCGEMPSNMFQAALFGHIKGAYTGAWKGQAGLLERANQGTLIVDDVDLLTTEAQSALLRFLDDGSFRVMGETGGEHFVDVRLIFTTNKDLRKLIAKDLFLPDLWFRMGGLALRTRPLRERPEDIRRFAALFLSQSGNEQLYFSEDALEFLTYLPWSGNVRELKRAVKNIALFQVRDKNEITLKHTAAILFDPEYPLTSSEDGAPDLQKIYEATRGNIALTARITGLSRNTVYKRLDGAESLPN